VGERGVIPGIANVGAIGDVVRLGHPLNVAVLC
jgi:hypothetical protein